MARGVEGELHFLERSPLSGNGGLLGLDFEFKLGFLVGKAGQFGACGLALFGEEIELAFGRMRFQGFEVGHQRLVTAGLAGLTLERADLPLDLLENVREPN